VESYGDDADPTQTTGVSASVRISLLPLRTGVVPTRNPARLQIVARIRASELVLCPGGAMRIAVTDAGWQAADGSEAGLALQIVVVAQPPGA